MAKPVVMISSPSVLGGAPARHGLRFHGLRHSLCEHLDQNSRRRNDSGVPGKHKLKLGEKTLRYGEHFGWGFKQSAAGTNRWMSGFRWESRFQQFLVWADQGISTM